MELRYSNISFGALTMNAVKYSKHGHVTYFKSDNTFTTSFKYLGCDENNIELSH